jgi:hypothetical protein
MLGTDSELMRAQVANPQSVNLDTWAVRVDDHRLNVLLIDKGRRSVAVRLRLPTTAGGDIERLPAPSAPSGQA